MQPGAHYAHFQTQLRTGLLRRRRLSSKLLLLFPQLLSPPHLCEARGHLRRLHGYMKTFSDFEIVKVFSGALLERVLTVDY